ncbi:hypothetical protein [Nocardiopsis algeriensis]|uniref:Uncharacterized protein n=1 Tax=Nocardiopsis algeriensis TaxID=1478215 RepID=A0A841ISK3_9ACTN|nr:hypothetical protein [Nocardiopsis algeriensis]MBB6119585.1 hypothetical protein [Nocardiopsis algeriensis]
MSVVLLFGAGALIGLVAFTAVILVTLLTERPGPPENPEEADAEHPAADRSVL